MGSFKRETINPAIIRAYDVRGRYPEEINERAVYLIARAFAQHIMVGQKRAARVVVSSDARPSSPALKEAFLKGLLEEGVHVIDAGLTTTPMHTFVVNRVGVDGGAMITASHNPAAFNGIKLSGPEGIPIGAGTGMEEIARIAGRGIFSPDNKKGTVHNEDFLSAYLLFLTASFPALFAPQNVGSAPSPLGHLMLDAGNGMTGLLLASLCKRLPYASVSVLYGDIDMTFPHHEANPAKAENMRDLQRALRQAENNDPSKKGWQIGAAFDGDGDRVGFVDEKGLLVPADLLTAVLAAYFLRERTETIVHDIISSRSVKEEIERHGGKAIESRVGHTFIKNAMRREQAVFGGESSGHYYFKAFFSADAALFAFLTVLDMIKNERVSLNELVGRVRRYAKAPEIVLSVADKDATIDRVAAQFSNAEISYQDGIKVIYQDWWFCLRPSNTEEVLRLNIEADTQELLEEKRAFLQNILENPS